MCHGLATSRVRLTPARPTDGCNGLLPLANDEVLSIARIPFRPWGTWFDHWSSCFPTKSPDWCQMAIQLIALSPFKNNECTPCVQISSLFNFFGNYLGWDALAKVKEGLEKENVKYKESPYSTGNWGCNSQSA